MPTRRDVIRAALALAGGALAQGCGLPGRGRDVPDVTIADEGDALAYALGAMRERYGEEFERAEGAETLVTDQSRYYGVTTYTLYLAPAADPGRVFGCDVAARVEDGRLDSVAADDYTQYRFKDQMERPFLEVVRSLEGLAGYSVRMTQPYMGDRDWRPSELEEYVNNGYTRPQVTVTLMMPRDGSPETWAPVVRGCLEGVWGLGRRMYVFAGLEGFEPYGRGNLYTLDSSQTDVEGRDSGPPSEEHVQREMEQTIFDADIAIWDGTGDGDDPGYQAYPQITWLPGHPVMG